MAASAMQNVWGDDVSVEGETDEGSHVSGNRTNNSSLIAQWRIGISSCRSEWRASVV